jgi:hypothetical protein
VIWSSLSKSTHAKYCKPVIQEPCLICCALECYQELHAQLALIFNCASTCKPGRESCSTPLEDPKSRSSRPNTRQKSHTPTHKAMLTLAKASEWVTLPKV